MEEYLVKVSTRDKGKTLRLLLKHEPIENALIFCNRKKDVDLLSRSLRRHKFQSAALHGDLAQTTREQTLSSFKNGELKLLVATDVAGRGLDIQGLSHVFNFDVPLHAEDYVHRIGRTGRAGKNGRAFMLGTPTDAKYITAITNLIGHNITHRSIQDLESLHPSEVSDGKHANKPSGSRHQAKTTGNHTARVDTGKSENSPSARSERDGRRKGPPPVKPEQSKTVHAKSGSNSVKSSQKKRPSAVGWGDHVPAFIQIPSRSSG